MEQIDKDFFKEISVLCVEDDDDVRENLTLFLKRRFKAVYEARNGLEGYDTFVKESPDIIMTDIQMPKLNGLEMSKKIRETNWLIPIIVVSAFEDLDYLKTAIEAGIGSYVTKPVDSEQLLNRLYKAALLAKYRLQDDKIRENEEIFRTLIEGSPNGICLYKDKFLFVNNSFLQMSGYSMDELKNVNPSELPQLNEHRAMFAQEIERRLLGEKFDMLYPDIPIVTKDGIQKYVSVATSTVKFKGQPVGIANVVDITERKWFESEINKKTKELESVNDELKENIQLVEQKNVEIKHQYYTDKLTGLPNRIKLIEDLRSSSHQSLILLNIDAFKEINDLYGTEAGDSVLKTVAERLQELIAGTHMKLYKLQADEYAIYGTKDITKEFLEESIAFIHKEIENYRVKIYDQEISIGITAGLAIDVSEKILAKADIALKDAKKRHKEYIIYDESMLVMKEYEQNIKWLHILKKAIDENRVFAHFQPIINNHNGKIEKFESLVRLLGEDGKVYTPYYFLSIAKRARLYHQITQRVMLDALATFKGTEYDFSINLSIEDIMDEKINCFIRDNLKDNPVARQVVFEILESDGIDNYEAVANFIKDVKEHGCKVAIDDFGSGYSNFAHILELDVDFLKIDASIIKKADTDFNSQIISQTIVDFSKRLNIKTVAEYVHSKEVYDMVKSFGVDYSQGFYLGEPKRAIQ